MTIVMVIHTLLHEVVMDTTSTSTIRANNSVAVIACAMDLEAEPMIALLDGAQSCTCGNAKCTTGFLAGRRVHVTVTGIGLVNAAVAATQAYLTFGDSLAAYLCAGTCGGLAATTGVLDVIIGTEFIYSRADATAFGYAPGQVPGEPASFAAYAHYIAAAETMRQNRNYRLLFGQVASSDAFVTTRSVEKTREVFPSALAADMESTAAAQVCAKFAVPFISIRAVSDLCGPQAGQDFHVDAGEAAAVSARAVADFFAQL
ncbi:MAG: 5'-methylthioadenosine/S-adenosylhomocysteine nucleosidase [Actinomycetaceae bacterium]|nr:5'-methylthioadenosine/S-adenosylhomocysteine nucleosidase [Actinomycetaceae bacterium]